MKVRFFEHKETVTRDDGSMHEFVHLFVEKGEGSQVFAGRATEEDKAEHKAEFAAFEESKDPEKVKAKRVAELKAELAALEGTEG